MRLLQLLHEAKPSSITGVIALYLQLDSCIMPRNKYVQSKSNLYLFCLYYRAPPFTGRAYYFLPNSRFTCQVMLILILFTLPLYKPYPAILPFPEMRDRWRFDCKTHIKLESILIIIKNYMASWLRNYQQLVHKSVWQVSKNQINEFDRSKRF